MVIPFFPPSKSKVQISRYRQVVLEPCLCARLQQKLPSNNHAEGVTLLSDITCSCACFIKHSDHIIALEIDVLDSNYVLSTALKRLQAL